MDSDRQVTPGEGVAIIAACCVGILLVLAMCGCETRGDSDQLTAEAHDASAWVEQRFGGTEPKWDLGACIWGEYEPGNLGTTVTQHVGHEYVWEIYISETLRDKPEARRDVMRHELRHLRGVDGGLE